MTGPALDRYRALLAEVDTWFRAVQSRHGAQMQCGSGCSDCCHGAFDIGPADIALVRDAFRRLPADVRARVRETAREHVRTLRVDPPYELEPLPESEIDRIVDRLGPAPCPLLDAGGRCLIYADRPSTCRFMGLPLVDADGDVVHGEWCDRNFTSSDPRALPGIRFGYSSWEADAGDLPISSSPRYTFIACAIFSEPESSSSP